MSKCFVGVDVGKYKSHIFGISQEGLSLFDKEITTSLTDFVDFLKLNDINPKIIGMEAGSISRALCLGLCRDGYNAISIDARHAAPILRAFKGQKTDKNDAYALSELLRLNGHKCVWIRSMHSTERLAILHFRNNLIKIEVDLKNSLSSHFTSFGEKVTFGQRGGYIKRIDQYLSSSEYSEEVYQIYDILKNVSREIAALDKKIQTYVSKSNVCSILMTMPGIGPLTSCWYEAIIDDPSRFHCARDVGAFLGLTPRVRQSGSIRKIGKISKCGSPELRRNMYLSARTLLYTVKKQSDLKKWAIKIKDKKGGKLATVALARKMSVTLHAMWASQKAFKYDR